jgi:hypothetical protein
MPVKHKSVTIARANELRKIIRDAAWKTSTSERYKTAPHQYIIATNSGPEWKFFADNIATYGEIRSWRGHRYKYLVVDEYCYWVMFPVLNRALVDSLDPVAL